MNLFTTSAPGSGDELRLAHCPPQAGPGLSHGGQMTVEAKWVPSYSSWELWDTPPFPRWWAALPKQSGTPRQTGHREGPQVQATTSPSPDQRTAGPMPPLHLSPARPCPMSTHPAALSALWGILVQAISQNAKRVFSHMQGPKYIVEINETLRNWLLEIMLLLPGLQLAPP